MLGPLTIDRGGVALDLPASRKLRGLLAYLALAPHPVGRSRICDLLWDGPNDPRGELRWCLSKLRRLLDGDGRVRVQSSDDTLALDLEDCRVDVLELGAAMDQGIETLSLERLRALSGLFAGEFLEGLSVERCPQFDAWLVAQRRRLRDRRVAILEHLVRALPADGDEALAVLERWAEVAPLDQRAHVGLLTALAHRGQIGAAEEHLEAASRLFDAEGLGGGRLRDAWRAVRSRPRATSWAAARPAEVAAAPAADMDAGQHPSTSRRASLAVMPFSEETAPGTAGGGRAGGFTHDIITRLAKLRDLFIIARGSVFALAGLGIGPEEAGRRLNVDYVASGSLRVQEARVLVRVELVEVQTARIVWAESFDHPLDDAFAILDTIGNQIVTSISNEIEMAERNRAILKPPNSLDAWEAYHRGLWHMYRFTRSENELARHYFERAVRLDPMFARAHAGLSFTHWQSAFQRWGDREEDGIRAYEAAGQSLLIDDHNPAAHWAMGRALWLRGQKDASLGALERAVELSPNFALGHYALSFVHAQFGDPATAIGSSDQSRHLSPFDPLLFGMLGARAMAHVRLGEFEEAAEWALKAAARPNAHAIILAIAAHCLALAGRIEEGRAFSASIRRMLPSYSVDDFLGTFQFTPDAARLFRHGARRIGLA